MGSEMCIRDRICDGAEIGSFGEVSPKVLSEFGLRTPINGGEFDVVALSRAAPDPIL